MVRQEIKAKLETAGVWTEAAELEASAAERLLERLRSEGIVSRIFDDICNLFDPEAFSAFDRGIINPGSTMAARWLAVCEKVDAILSRFNEAMEAGPAVEGQMGYRFCPFCGGTPRLNHPSYDGPADCWGTYISCGDCDAQAEDVLREHGDDQVVAVAEAWDNWHRRSAARAESERSATYQQFIAAIEAKVGDRELATQVWRSILTVSGVNPVGLTQPGQIEMVRSGLRYPSGQFWPKRDEAEFRAQMDDPDMPDDVPLYTAPLFLSYPVEQVRVRKVNWTVLPDGNESTHVAETVVGKYAAWVSDGKAYAILPHAQARQLVGSTIDDALAFAQNDFDRQIRSALAA